jgi:cyclophilin family peptidyl-prolyl cis-trans isomerase/protein-disulfide isomerase
MRRILLPVLFVFALVLSACGSTQTQSTTAAVPTTAAASSTPVSPTPTTAPYTDDKNPCKPFNILDSALPASPVKIPDVTSTDWVQGSADAVATLIVYTDLQCPYCAQADPIFMSVLKARPNDVRLVFRHWPLASIHPNAVQAAIAAEAAGKQGKFFNMTEFLFSKQSEWSGKSAVDFTTWLNSNAINPTLGLDTAKFANDLKDAAIAQKVKGDMAASDKLGGELTNAFQTGFGTPTLIINGSPFLSQRSEEVLTLIVDLIKNKNKANLQCPANTLDISKDYTATLTTNKGDIVIDLLEKVAPVTVNSFISLAQSGWFKDNIFFVVRDEFAMTGDKTNTGMGGPGYAYKDEINSAYTFDKEGVVGMYNFGPGTNSSQFFILKAPLSALNGRYTIFGNVIQGMDILKSLIKHEANDSPDKADKILNVSITTK